MTFRNVQHFHQFGFSKHLMCEKVWSSWLNSIRTDYNLFLNWAGRKKCQINKIVHLNLRLAYKYIFFTAQMMKLNCWNCCSSICFFHSDNKEQFLLINWYFKLLFLHLTLSFFTEKEQRLWVSFWLSRKSISHSKL